MAKRESVYNPEADKRWYEKNRKHKLYLNDRTSARRFIRDKATLEDLEELEQLIEQRKLQLKESD
ncbi:MAG: hypothetical protein ACOX3H_06900 [Saccharofermentanales bacterium]|jgi:hypothetical protein